MTAGGRSGGRAGGCGVAVALLVLVCPPTRLPAQDTLAVRDTVVVPDTAPRRVGPLGALWRSLLLPGWGQAASDRHTVGALFVAWEGVTIMMSTKARGEARHMEQTGSPLAGAKRQEVEDWVVLWVFNHLFAGAEAFVAAHLRDFPADLRLRAVPGGIAVSVPLPRP